MFDNLQDKLADTFRALRGQHKLSEENIEEAVRQVRMSFLEADVNFRVVKDFVEAVKVKALGAEVWRQLNPGQQFVKIVHDELVEMLGSTSTRLDLETNHPVVIMMVGLQGCGKTTSAAKLAKLLTQEFKRKVLLVPADVYRPAAIEQLTVLGGQIGVDVFPSQVNQHPAVISVLSREMARENGHDVLIIDTAGRLQIDERLMEELAQLKRAMTPNEILFTADAMTGQEAVNVAERFNQVLDITGVVLTKMDGDARGGAALSIKAVTQKPLKFVGMGERLDDLEVFHPDRIAQRILGMGDVLTLIEKAQKSIDQDEAARMAEKMRKNDFSLEDFAKSLQAMKKMGSMGSILGMLPGMKDVARMLEEGEEGELAKKEMVKIEAMIGSMTRQERADHSILNGSRRRRIAQGSGTNVADLNRLLKQFLEMRKMMKQMNSLGMGKLGGMLGRLRGLASDGPIDPESFAKQGLPQLMGGGGPPMRGAMPAPRKATKAATKHKPRPKPQKKRKK